AVLAEEEEKLGEEGERIESSLREAYAAADNAVRNKADQFFKTPASNPTFEVKFNDGNYTHYFFVPAEIVIDLNDARKLLEKLLTDWQSELTLLNSSNAKSFSPMAIEKMNTVSNFLNKVAYAVNAFTPAEYVYENTVAGYKTAIDSARTSVTGAREGLIDASRAGQARVDQIKSSILALESSLQKSKIVAPFAGVVSKQEAKAGESVTVGEGLVVLISDNDIYIEANVSEINVGKIQNGNKAKIELDAFPDEFFEGQVAFIDPAETIVDKVVNYKIKILLLETKFPNERNLVSLKSGLTANVKITANEKQNVLSVPIYAIIKEGDKSFVNKLGAGEAIKTEIETGLLGSNGVVEILSGLAEGDKILVSSDH
ncbi:MAG: efflux RND transporter periplasmic adaptor subunit, partial [Patescibacteria group bacterium]